MKGLSANLKIFGGHTKNWEQQMVKPNWRAEDAVFPVKHFQYIFFSPVAGFYWLHLAPQYEEPHD